jgi:hypothetical protein
MHQNEHNLFVDALLGASLRQYRNVDLRPGLENRILARLRAEQVDAPWRAWAWRMGAGLAAAGVILALVAAAHRLRLQMPISATQSRGSGPNVEASRQTTAVLRGQSFTRRRQDRGQMEHSAKLQRASADPVSKSAAVAHLGKPGSTGVAQSPARQKEARRAAFPSPAPLSGEERLLVSLVRQLPERTWAAFPEWDETGASSRVPDLNIPPIETKDLSGDTLDGTK